MLNAWFIICPKQVVWTACWDRVFLKDLKFVLDFKIGILEIGWLFLVYAIFEIVWKDITLAYKS